MNGNGDGDKRVCLLFGYSCVNLDRHSVDDYLYLLTTCLSWTHSLSNVNLPTMNETINAFLNLVNMFIFPPAFISFENFRRFLFLPFILKTLIGGCNYL